MSRYINTDIPFFLDSGEINALGALYFGEPNQDAKTNPKTPYLDEGLTTPASTTQALTSGGKLQQKLWLDGDYSVVAEDVNGVQVDEDLSAAILSASGITIDINDSTRDLQVYLDNQQVPDYATLISNAGTYADNDVVEVARRQSGQEGGGSFLIVEQDLSAEAANDPEQGIIIELVAASKYAVRRMVTDLKVEFWGAVADWDVSGATGTDSTTAIQAAVDYLPRANQRRDFAIDKPNGAGGVISLAYTGADTAYKVSTLTLPTWTTLKGQGSGSTTVVVSGSVQWKALQFTNFQVCWGIRVKGIQFRGQLGTEDLFRAADFDLAGGTTNWNRYPLLDSYFEDVEWVNANKGFAFSGGWNNVFNRCSFRNSGVGTELDSSYDTTNLSGSSAAFCDDNLFLDCEYNNCDRSVRMRYSIGNRWLTCPSYSAQVEHFFIGDESKGNQVVGGRLEQAANQNFTIRGGNSVVNGGTTYICILQHTSDATNEPGVGASWATYWVADGSYPAIKTWAPGLTYRASQAKRNKFEDVNQFEGPASWFGRDGNTVTRNANYVFGRLDGDQYTIIADCYNGNNNNNDLDISSLSISANITDNLEMDFPGTNAGIGTYIVEHSFNERPCATDGANEILGYTDDYNLKLPTQAGIVTAAAAATSTVFLITNNSSADIAFVTPRNASAAALTNVYAVPEANDKIRVYHSAAAGGEEFQVTLIGQ